MFNYLYTYPLTSKNTQMLFNTQHRNTYPQRCTLLLIRGKENTGFIKQDSLLVIKV